jgi:hypothetical protein
MPKNRDVKYEAVDKSLLYIGKYLAPGGNIRCNMWYVTILYTEQETLSSAH